MTRVLLCNGRVHTPADPGATALLICDGRIAWVGHEGAALAQRDGVDRMIDLGGALVTPAFVDAHVHVTATGMNLLGLDLTGAHGRGDVLRLVADYCRDLPAGRIVLGHGWDETTWDDPVLPTREDLDRVAPGVAVYLTRIDVHSAIASTALLDRLPRIATKTGFDPSGVIRSDAHHDARGAVLDSIPAEQRRHLHDTALSAFAAAGIAAVHEMAGPDISSQTDLRELLAADQGVRPLVTAYWGELGGAATARRLGAVGAGGDLFADGALGSHTAWLSSPYRDDPASTGAAHVTWADVRDHVVDCAAEGIQSGFHVIGDAAIDEVVRGMAAAADRIGIGAFRSARHRLEHVEMPSPWACEQISRLGVTVSAQPAFDRLWGGPGRMYAERLGRQRAATMNPFAALQRAGVPLAFGSDTPVTAIDPWGAVSAAVHHRTPEHRISARGAFSAHTRGGWRAAGIDDAGVLAPGAAAHLAVWRGGDLVVQAPDERIAAWSTDPRSGTPVLPRVGPDVERPEAILTMCAGRVIHDAGLLA
jgi:hypothetical protein